MKQHLKLGVAADSGAPFIVPVDLVARTCAYMGIVGSGKTSAAKRAAEEMARCGLPWICLDPVGVWWGIRAGRDGQPGGGYPAVVIGGPHGDLPLERDAGARIAQALISEHVCAVIDLSRESKKFWHTFMTDFALELMQLSPDTPRHLFLEEAPEFVPQRTRVDLTARCKEAVERLIRLGRNSGYGFSLITQRPATVDKDVLSQCENLFVFRTVGAHDRKALKEWMLTNEPEAVADVAISWTELAAFKAGEAWFWSPAWLRKLQQVRMTQSTTFHPGATRQIGRAIASVQLSDVQTFVTKLQKQLSKTTAAKAVKHKEQLNDLRSVGKLNDEPAAYQTPEALALREEIRSAQAQITDWRHRALESERRLEAVKKLIEPKYRQLQAVFEAVGDGAAPGGGNRSAYALWLEKATGGQRRILEILIERGETTMNQLATLAGVAPRTCQNCIVWLKRNGLIEKSGTMVRLRSV